MEKVSYGYGPVNPPGYLGSAAACESRQPDVPAAIESLSCAINDQGDLIARLELKLGRVLRPSGPEAVNKCGGPLRSCELSTQIGAASEMIGASNFRLRDLLDRLEL
jgi:hypothetical protein